MSLTQTEKELLQWFLDHHVPEYLKFVTECWENPVLQDEMRRRGYTTCLDLLVKLRELNVSHEPLLYEEQIKEYLKNPFGD
jgi:hypothetical protein